MELKALSSGSARAVVHLVEARFMHFKLGRVMPEELEELRTERGI